MQLEKSKKQIKKILEDWGSLTDITIENSYSVVEYELNKGKEINVNLSSINSDFVIVSGSGKFYFNNQSKTLYKGDKLSIDSQTFSDRTLCISNCGVIPLLFIAINLF